LFDLFRRALEYALSHSAELTGAVKDHLWLSAVALAISAVVCVPLGILTARSRIASLAAINGIGVLRVIPSLAVLFLVIPYLGLSTASAAVALTALALPPVLVNTDAAFRGVDRSVIEVADSMGMTAWQRLWRVEIPLALPLVLAGIRTASVEVISSATLAAFVGSGGLGIYITRGFALYDLSILLVGAVPVALLTFTAEGLFGLLQSAARRGVRNAG
jgi:osmoprotectant transport system permease protein